MLFQFQPQPGQGAASVLQPRSYASPTTVGLVRSLSQLHYGLRHKAAQGNGRDVVVDRKALLSGPLLPQQASTYGIAGAVGIMTGLPMQGPLLYTPPPRQGCPSPSAPSSALLGSFRWQNSSPAPTRMASNPTPAVAVTTPRTTASVRQFALPHPRFASPQRVVIRTLKNAEEVSSETCPRQPILRSLDLEGIARYILERGCKRIVVMCGAGISTSAGIPDFRTPGSGLYANLQKYNLPTPESIFQLSYFRKSPGAFYELAKSLWPGNHSPTVAHYFIRLLEDKGILLRCYSQNIDSLERLAGISASKLVAAHGNFDGAHVIDTFPEVEVDVNELKAAIDAGEAGWQALRMRKGNLVKPKITFFGESLPQRFLDLHEQDMRQCDLLIVLGTSLVVGPFNSLVGLAPSATPRLLINRQSAGTCNKLRNGFRFHLNDGTNTRDAWHRSDCDEGCRTLAASLGWAWDLDALVKSRGGNRFVFGQRLQGRGL